MIRSRDVSKERDSEGGDKQLIALLLFSTCYQAFKTRSAWMKCAFPSSQFLDRSVSHLPVSCFPGLLHTSMHTQRNNNFSKWAQPWAVKSRCKRRSLSADKKNKGRRWWSRRRWWRMGRRRKSFRKSREEATVSHVQRHSWCDWAAWVRARWVTETEGKMKGCGRVQWKRKRRITVKLKAGQRQMEIQGDWYACHSGKSQRYELGGKWYRT